MRCNRQTRQKPESEIRIAIYSSNIFTLSSSVPAQGTAGQKKSRTAKTSLARNTESERTMRKSVSGVRRIIVFSLFQFPLGLRLLARQVTGLSVLCTFILFSLLDLFYFYRWHWLCGGRTLQAQTAYADRQRMSDRVRVQLKNVNRIYIPSHFTDANPAAIYHRCGVRFMQIFSFINSMNNIL